VDGSGNESLPASPGTTTAADAPAPPDHYQLLQNVPNPFNPTTTIRFDLPARSRVTLTVFDVNGRLIRVLVDRDLDAGTRSVTWDGRDSMGRSAASGVYFYRLETPNYGESRKMILLK